MITIDAKVYLRAFELDDYKTTAQWRKDDEIWDMAGTTKYIVSEEYEKKWIYDAIWDKNKIYLGICASENNELIGYCGIKDLDWVNRTAMIVNTIGNKKYWGKGMGTEANLKLLYFIFNERGFNRIWGIVAERNMGSRRMLEKMGFVFEGKLRQVFYRHGTYIDGYMVSILKNDYNDMHGKKFSSYLAPLPG